MPVSRTVTTCPDWLTSAVVPAGRALPTPWASQSEGLATASSTSRSSSQLEGTQRSSGTRRRPSQDGKHSHRAA